MTTTRGRRSDAPPPALPRSRASLAALAIAVLGLVLGGAALAITVTRPTGAAGCRQLAWNSLPAPEALPGGWTAGDPGYYVDSLSATLAGPTPSDGSQAPAIFVSVNCFGPDAHDALVRSKSASVAAGRADVALGSVGDEAFASRDAGSGTLIAFVRRGDLLANLASSGSLDDATFRLASIAVDQAMVGALAGKPGPSFTPRAPESAQPSASAGASPSSSDSATSHVDPALEAELPKAVGSTALTTESMTASGALGDDPTSVAMTSALKDLGKTPDDLRIAEAYDETGSLDLYVFAFRVDGVTGAKLRSALAGSWVAGAASGVTASPGTIAGKKVTVVDYGGGGAADYLYDHGDVVFDVETGDASLATQVLGLLP